MKNVLLSVVLIALMSIAATGVAADHEANIDLSPDIANCDELGNTFTVNVENSGASTNEIIQVEIYKALAGIVSNSFECGAAPSGWDLFAYTDRCIYVTELAGSDKIAPGDDLDFTFNATMKNNSCQSGFIVVTIDDDAPTGDRDTIEKFVDIDCTDPLITKEVMGTSVPMDPDCDANPANNEDGVCDWWIRQTPSSTLDFAADDSTDRDQCNLGVDYCEWQLTLDGTLYNDQHPAWDVDYCDEMGGTIVDGWCRLENGEVLEWEFGFEEDSEHTIEVRCVDEAGNMASLTETDKVDDTPPTTEHDVSPDAYVDGGVTYLDTIHTITLSADDGGEVCAISDEPEHPLTTYYKDNYFPDDGDWDACWNACSGWQPTPQGDDSYKVYDGGPLSSGNESCHVLEYYSEDALGNVEEVNTFCYFTDKSIPTLKKDNNDAIEDSGDADFMTPENPDGTFHWITPDMPVSFACADEGPHPSGGEQLCYKVGYDVPAWESDVTADYCDEPDENGYCCVAIGEMESNRYDFYFNEDEDSKHSLEYFCRDAVGKQTTPHTQYYKVDSQAPNITKQMRGVWAGECPPEPGSADECFVIADPDSGVTATVEDEGAVCASGIDTGGCHYEIWWQSSQAECDDANGDDYVDGWCLVDQSDFSDRAEISFTEDSTHELRIVCEDRLGNTAEDVETFLVDDTPPVTTKTYGEPRYPEDGYGPYCVEVVDDGCMGGCMEEPNATEEDCYEQCPKEERCGTAKWITPQTPVSLSVFDEKVKNETIYWRNLYIPDPEEADKVCGHGYSRPPRETCGEDERCEPALPYCDPNYYMEEGVVENPDEPFQSYSEPFFKSPESCHVIEYYSVDLLGNEEPLKWQCVFVDDTPPEGIKVVGEPSEYIGEGGDADCSESPDPNCGMGIDWFVGQKTIVSLSCEDQLPHPVDYERLCYKISYEGDARGSQEVEYYTERYCEEFGGDYNETSGYCCVPEEDVPVDVGALTQEPSYGWDLEYRFNFLEDSIHNVEFYCEDALGNTNEEDIEWFAVDTKPPVTTKTYLEPVYTEERCEQIATRIANGGDEPYPEECWNVTYIDTASRVELDPNDPDPHPSGVEETFYRYRLVDDEYCEYPDSCHVGIEGEVTLDVDGDLSDWNAEQFVFTDTVALRDNDGPDDEIIDHAYDLYMAVQGDYLFVGIDYRDDVTDNEDGIKVFFETNDGDDNFEGGIDWQEGDDTPYWQDYVGTMTPIGDVGGAYVRGWQAGHRTYEAMIPLSLLGLAPGDDVKVGVYTLDGIHPAVDRIRNSYPDAASWSWSDTSNWYAWTLPGGWLSYDEPFPIPEESCHVIEYYSIDALENDETVHAQCVFVDKTPPQITKTYSEPYFSDDVSEWISVETEVTLDAVDVGPHPSGLDTLEYRWQQVDDLYCENVTRCEEASIEAEWRPYVEPFNVDEQSCHVIEARATDNVEKQSTHRQCVFVDDTPPTPNKFVGEPKSSMSVENQRLGAAFYPELDPEGENVCAEGDDKCYDITLLTPIDMVCEDAEPHPVGNEGVCFQVDFDDEDVTEAYCNDTDGGVMNEQGYCCVDEELRGFYFKKTSWHKLGYYCYDALNNTNREDVDIEYFKVGDTVFEIELNKKWNLISVPVRLLDDSMDEVFAGLEDVVVSVWHYDGSEWHIYTPDGDSTNDDITTMHPGWGYWILATDDANLTIGGNLLNPATSVPEVPVTHGWNLLGYFGAEEQEGYYGPDENGVTAQCAFYNIGESVWDKGFTGVWSYWEPYNPDMWLSFGRYDNLDPGAGYWVFATEDGIHTLPPEDCRGLGPIGPIGPFN